MLRTVPRLSAPEPERSDPVSIDPLAALAAAAAAGDPGSTQTLVVSVAPALLRAVRGVLGSRHPDVEDVAQEAAMGFVDALGSFRRECTVTHFACRVGVFTALKARRRLRARGDAYGADGEVDAHTGPDASPAELAQAARRRQVLRTLCEELPESQSEALVMHVVLGCTVEEVAGATGAPLNTVRSRLRLAKESLRARIEADPVLRDTLEVRS